MQRDELLKLWNDAWTEGLWAAAWGKAIDDLTPAQATWTPAPGRHSIWQIVNHVIFWREHDQLTGPLIDDDPRVPFSERRGIRPFDGTRNYIDWFRTATTDEIRQQVFKDAAGNAVAAPGTLLYRLLRESFLAELGRAGRALVTRLSPDVCAELEVEPVIANVGGAKSFSTTDVLNVDASRIGATADSWDAMQQAVLAAVESGAIDARSPDQITWRAPSAWQDRLY